MDTEDGLVSEATSLVQVKIGGRIYDAQRSNRCGVCNHPGRMAIEKAMILDEGYRNIVMRYSGTQYIEGGVHKTYPQFSITSILNHRRNGHMPVEAAAVERLKDIRAQELGQQYEHMTDTIVDGQLVANVVLRKGYEALVNGDITPSVSETLKAAEIIKAFQDDTGGQIDVQAWADAQRVYFEEARKVMDDDQWDEFTGRLRINPILKAIAQKMSTDQSDEIVEAEVVDNE